MSGRNAVGKTHFTKPYHKHMDKMRQKDEHGCPVPLQGKHADQCRNNPVSANKTPSTPTDTPPTQNNRRRVNNVIEQITSPTSSNASPPSKRSARRLIKSRSFSNSFAFSLMSSLSDSYRSVSFKYFSRSASVFFASARAPSKSAIPCTS